LDSDVILESATLAPLVEACEQYPQVGVIGSAVYDPRERKRLVAAGLHVEGKSGDITFVIPQAKRQLELIDVDLIAACSLMVRSEACEQVGLWDESLRLYWGDTDWCARFVRAGYRVVCQPTSKVWHRDWTDVDRGFFTPVYLHDHIRGALLYSVRHDPQRSLASARRLVLKSYLRAALEQLTMRHAFARGYEWAIKDFLAASFGERSFETIVGHPLLPNLNSIVTKLGSCFTQTKRLTVTGSCDPQIRTELTEQLRAQFAVVEWPDDDEPRSKYPTTWEWLRQLAQLVVGFFMLPFRKDLLVAAPSRPRMTNLVAARYTLFVDAQGRGLVYHNRVLPGLWRWLTTGVKGLWNAFINLPQAVKSAPLQAAIHAVDVSPKSVSSEDHVSEIKPSQVYAAQ
jgi:GT2 family glycosyltransferase